MDDGVDDGGYHVVDGEADDHSFRACHRARPPCSAVVWSNPRGVIEVAKAGITHQTKFKNQLFNIQEK